MLLHRFHQARPPVPGEGFGAAKVAEFDALAPLASALLGKRELALARAEVEALAGLASGEGPRDPAAIPRRRHPCSPAAASPVS
jgi:hypothetical protein